jgi:hypothetical protein
VADSGNVNLVRAARKAQMKKARFLRISLPHLFEPHREAGKRRGGAWPAATVAPQSKKTPVAGSLTFPSGAKIKNFAPIWDH